MLLSEVFFFNAKVQHLIYEYLRKKVDFTRNAVIRKIQNVYNTVVAAASNMAETQTKLLVTNTADYIVLEVKRQLNKDLEKVTVREQPSNVESNQG